MLGFINFVLFLADMIKADLYYIMTVVQGQVSIHSRLIVSVSRIGFMVKHEN